MRVFVTGATGFIGTPLVKELLSAGHQVLGLARSDEKARELAATGAHVHRGDLENLDSLRSGASASDAVIHTAFNHDFSKFVANCESDRKVIGALALALEGSKRPLVITSGTAMAKVPRGQAAQEDSPVGSSKEHPRAATEEAAAAAAARGVTTSIVRLPQVHNPVKQGLITYLILLAREKGVSAMVGDGSNRWPAAHVLDVARLYRLALERQVSGSIYHAVAEEGVPMKDIAEAIGRGLKIPVVSKTPEEVAAHFGWLAMFAGLDLTASSVHTRQTLGWSPTGPGLIADLNRMRF